MWIEYNTECLSDLLRETFEKNIELLFLERFFMQYWAVEGQRQQKIVDLSETTRNVSHCRMSHIMQDCDVSWAKLDLFHRGGCGLASYNTFGEATFIMIIVRRLSEAKTNCKKIYSELTWLH
jgi:hypothetical protein